MAKSSINFKPVKPNSERHNLRTHDLDYVKEDLTKENVSWSIDSVQDRTEAIKKHCKEVSGRKLQKNANPIKEACVNVQEHHTIEHLKDLATALEKEFGIKCFQIHLHRDEGHKAENGEWKPNYHAHMLFDWQNKEKGTVLNFNPLKMSQIQTFVAKNLGMERGELRTNSNRERLEPIEFKRQQEELRHQKLQQQNAELEQKKNEVRARIESVGEPIDSEEWKERLKRIILSSVYEFDQNQSKLSYFDEKQLNWAIEGLERAIQLVESDIEKIKKK